jgi:hypothetical protein
MPWMLASDVPCSVPEAEMVSSVGESSPPRDIFASCDQLVLTPPRQEFSPDNSSVLAIDVRSLAPRTELVVKTRNSRYHLIMCQGGSRALIQGGHDFPQEIEARVGGATLGGSCLKVGWVAVGLSLEIAIGSGRVLTSPVRSIDIMSRPAELG